MNIRKFFSCVCVLLCTLFSVLTAKEVQVESKLTADKTLDRCHRICISPEMRRWLPM